MKQSDPQPAQPKEKITNPVENQSPRVAVG